jgi:hypothetical protein
VTHAQGHASQPAQSVDKFSEACLTCPVFITTPEFLDQHRQQTRRLLTSASANGQLRLVEMNQQVLTNLDRIIGALEAHDGETDDGREVADAG